TLGVTSEIKGGDRCDAQTRRSQKYLIRIGQIIYLVNPFEYRDEVFVRDIDDAFTRDARERAAAQRRRMERAILRPEQVRRRRRHDLTAFIHHNRFIEVAALSLFPRKHVIEIVQALDAR